MSALQAGKPVPRPFTNCGSLAVERAPGPQCPLSSRRLAPARSDEQVPEGVGSVPERQGLQSEGRGDRVDIGQEGAGGAPEIEAAIDARICGRGLERG